FVGVISRERRLKANSIASRRTLPVSGLFFGDLAREADLLDDGVLVRLADDALHVPVQVRGDDDEVRLLRADVLVLEERERDPVRAAVAAALAEEVGGRARIALAEVALQPLDRLVDLPEEVLVPRCSCLGGRHRRKVSRCARQRTTLLVCSLARPGKNRTCRTEGRESRGRPRTRLRSVRQTRGCVRSSWTPTASSFRFCASAGTSDAPRSSSSSSRSMRGCARSRPGSSSAPATSSSRPSAWSRPATATRSSRSRAWPARSPARIGSRTVSAPEAVSGVERSPGGPARRLGRSRRRRQ